MKQVAEVKADIKRPLKGLYYSSTTDAWIACNNITYTTCTAHFIDRRTWIIHHFALGIFKKTGTSKVEDVVRYYEGIWQTVSLSYEYCSATMMDTEEQCVKLEGIC
jgi:hypothetical protein